jgi:Fe-S cluster assembly iron-binding protein IscA
MLTVTESAKEKLQEALEQQTSDPELAIRITTSGTDPNQLDMILDKMKENDQVIKNKSGNNLLLIGTDIAPALDGMVIDFKETPQGQNFTISKHEPEK